MFQSSGGGVVMTILIISFMSHELNSTNSFKRILMAEARCSLIPEERAPGVNTKEKLKAREPGQS